MTDSQNGQFVHRVVGMDRLGYPYAKEVRFSNADDLSHHKVEIGMLLESLTYHEDGERAGVPDDALEASAKAIIDSVACYIGEWGAARLPSTIRRPVHALQDTLDVTRTDFGVDVGVATGAPYNYTGYPVNHFVNTVVGTDRLGNPYTKVIRFSTAQGQSHHKVEIDMLLESLAYHRDGEQAGVPGDDLQESAMGIIDAVAVHIEEWGAARLPSTIRRPVHVLQDTLGVTRTDFGVDVGVTKGAPYNYIG